MGRPWCKHYSGMHEKEQCEAGVPFASLEFYGTQDFRTSCPCFGPEYPGRCEHKEYPTAAELAAEDAAFDATFENVAKARAAIVERCGGPWKRGMAGTARRIDCPVCAGKETLAFTRSGYNGHIHAQCSTADCVSWME